MGAHVLLGACLQLLAMHFATMSHGLYIGAYDYLLITMHFNSSNKFTNTGSVVLCAGHAHLLTVALPTY